VIEVTAGAGTGRELVLDDVATEVLSPVAVDIISVFALLLPKAPPLPLAANTAGVAIATSGTVTLAVTEFCKKKKK
jgi:hypothetical protein